MSREVWKADFQIQVWQKIQTLNPENPGIALKPASESLFFNPTRCFRRRGFYVENGHKKYKCPVRALKVA